MNHYKLNRDVGCQGKQDGQCGDSFFVILVEKFKCLYVITDYLHLAH
jgi:hypothetical protein